MELEKLIRAQSESLAARIDDNRSRLRICRAWLLHFVLIGIRIVVWNQRVGILDMATQTWLLAGDLLFLILTWRATLLLAVDHLKDLRESFDIVVSRPKDK